MTNSLSADPDDYCASAVLAAGSAYCGPKAVLFAAAARAAGSPSRLGFADVRNHLQSEQDALSLGTDLFVFHTARASSSSSVSGDRPARRRSTGELCARFRSGAA